MGLDAVEIVMRAEEFYSITVTDHEAAQIRTVGEFYSLMCSKLDVVPLEKPRTAAILPKVAEYERSLFILRKRTSLLPPTWEVLPWTGQSVWDAFIAILVDQQCLKPSDIHYTSRFVEDLGVD